MANEIVFTMTYPQENATGVAMVTYAVDTRENAGRVLKAVLKKIEFNDTCDIKMAVMKHVPLQITYAPGMPGAVPEQMGPWVNSGGKVKDVTEFDVSFGKFWEMYGYKVGNKAGAEKAWCKLGLAERILAIGAIPRLQRHCELHKTDLPYPSTYLNQRRWENEFEG